jgi:hypothetical protein
MAHTAPLLGNGEVLVAGGGSDDEYSGFLPLVSAELYDPSAPAIISPQLATATVGLPFSYQFEAPGAPSLEVNNLPTGLTFDPALRTIIGSTTGKGTFQIGLTASNPFGTTNNILTIEAQPFPTSGPVVISVTSASGPTGLLSTFKLLQAGAARRRELLLQACRRA